MGNASAPCLSFLGCFSISLFCAKVHISYIYYRHYLRLYALALTQLVGTNYDHNEFTEGDKKHPTKADLNKIDTTKPIVVVHQSGHMGVLNQKALDDFGIIKI
jgi:hypothetical protein